jgi:hypothetical protein
MSEEKEKEEEKKIVRGIVGKERLINIERDKELEDKIERLIERKRYDRIFKEISKVKGERIEEIAIWKEKINKKTLRSEGVEMTLFIREGRNIKERTIEAKSYGELFKRYFEYRMKDGLISKYDKVWTNCIKELALEEISKSKEKDNLLKTKKLGERIEEEIYMIKDHGSMKPKEEVKVKLSLYLENINKDALYDILREYNQVYEKDYNGIKIFKNKYNSDNKLAYRIKYEYDKNKDRYQIAVGKSKDPQGIIYEISKDGVYVDKELYDNFKKGIDIKENLPPIKEIENANVKINNKVRKIELTL